MIQKVLAAAIAAIAAVILVDTSASADEWRDQRAGTKGHVTAWETDRETVIDVEACPRWGHYTWDYVKCGKALRTKVNEAMCRDRGKGHHKWLEQVGNNRSLITNTAFCD